MLETTNSNLAPYLEKLPHNLLEDILINICRLIDNFEKNSDFDIESIKQILDIKINSIISNREDTVVNSISNLFIEQNSSIQNQIKMASLDQIIRIQEQLQSKNQDTNLKNYLDSNKESIQHISSLQNTISNLLDQVKESNEFNGNIKDLIEISLRNYFDVAFIQNNQQIQNY